jgi:N-acetylglucosaminyl-diphospho-decaprenol L-rhamnosyltransferase
MADPSSHVQGTVPGTVPGTVTESVPRSEAAASVSVVVVTYNALPWLERCLDSVAEYETIVVDNGSMDGTVELVRERYPQVKLIEQPNVGLAAGWSRGIESAAGRFLLLLNADAWAVGNAVMQLAAFADEHPQAAMVGPKLLNTDGSLQRSVRGFPTLWRLATEYFFLRKLAPRSHALNAFYAGDFDHDETREVEWVMGACLFVRRDAIDAVGPPDSTFFLFSEETDWCYRFRQAGWSVVFYPDAEIVHVSGASHGGRFFRENVRSHLRFFAKHHGAREAERARRLMLWALRLRGVLFRGERGRMYRDTASWLASGSARRLVDESR